MSRTSAREIALHIVYELGFGQYAASELLEKRLSEEEFAALGEEHKVYLHPAGETDTAYIRTLVMGVDEHDYELGAYIEKYSVAWAVSRISRVSTAIMKLAMYEILYMEEIPGRVSINEAVELAKKYDEPLAAGFINGILGKFIKEEHAE